MNLGKNVKRILFLLILCVFSIVGINSKPAVAASSWEPYIGQISLFAFGYEPRGWAECKGQLISVNQNQALFSLIGTKFGGDGTTNFKLPDLQNASPIPNAKYYIAMRGIYPQRDGGGSHATIGSIALFPYDFAPGDWASCDGTIMNIGSNTVLFNLLDVNYGGDGSTTFGIPNLNNASPINNNIKYCICVYGIYPSRDYGPASLELIGSIDLYAFKFNSDASDVAECKGQTIQIANNEILFSLIETTYGGNGSSSFGVPDLRGAVPSPDFGYYISMNGIYPTPQ